MSPAAEIRIIMGRELGRSFRTVKGVFLALIALAGGAGLSMLFAWMDRVKRDALPPGIDIKDVQEPLFESAYGAETAKVLAACPYSLWMMLVATMWIAQILVSLLDYDAVSGEVQHRSVRFWTVRTRRSSYIVGKFLGAWLTVLAVTLGVNVIVWIVTVSVGQMPVGQVLSWGIRFYAVTVPITGAWCGIALLVGSLFRTPMMSLLAISAAFSGLLIVRIVAAVSERDWMAYTDPNIYDVLLLSPEPSKVALGLLGSLGIAAMTTGAAAVLFETRDV